MSIDRWTRIWGISGSQDNGANQFVVNLNANPFCFPKIDVDDFPIRQRWGRIKKPKSDWWITVLLVCQMDQKND